ncbi:beta-lactamase family protein [Microvirga sp. BT689]|uniref:serine hydrolase domain-containing protein n=1 Tax=Microvirga arvi TaxID=2778731 RepID=UPI001951BCDF|nr:serine hydrolase domain-containing protein [Microvirga arvi]MBM6582040.1 beta-lactamase family protein [Microvirga arvi]
MVEAWALVEDGIVAESHDADRLVPWWSFTKTVLAATALVLVRDGLVGLDDPVADKPYTLRHLLQHRSGLANYGGFRAYHEAVERNDEPWPVPELLSRLDADRLRYPAGEGWDYSNIGYLVIGQLVETISGSDLNEALRRFVLKPLGIENARIAGKRADLAHAALGSAAGYHPGWVYHGLLAGSVADAVLLLDRLMAGHLLPPSLLGEMLTPFVLPGPVPERPWTVPGYGLGVMTGETSSGRRVVGHTGGGPGSTIAIYRTLTGARARTAGFFRTSEDQAKTEKDAFRLLEG